GHGGGVAGLADRALEREAVGEQPLAVEVDALEEEPRLAVRVLVGLEDVGAVAVEHLRERGDDPAAVGARDEQGRGVGAGGRGHGGGGVGRFFLVPPPGGREAGGEGGSPRPPVPRRAEGAGGAERPGGAVRATTEGTGTGCEVWASQGVLDAGLGGESVHQRCSTASEVAAS